MTKLDRAQEVAEVLAAAGDPTRVRLLNALAAGELCVCDLSELLELPQPRVSRHLALLRAAGLVRARRVGRYMHYALADPPDPLRRGIVQVLRATVGRDDLLAAERQRAARRRMVSACRPARHRPEPAARTA